MGAFYPELPDPRVWCSTFSIFDSNLDVVSSGVCVMLCAKMISGCNVVLVPRLYLLWL